MALTLLALTILMQLFKEDRDEWKLIEKKGKNFVKSQQIERQGEIQA